MIPSTLFISFLPLACLGLLALLTACGDLKSAPGALTARTTTAAQAMACDACHGYPLTDRNHDYHLFIAGADRRLNGRITCLDCHVHSLRGEQVVVIDSLFWDSGGGDYFTSLHPGAQDTTIHGQIIRGLTLVRVDTLHQNHPVPQPDRPGAHPRFREYVTALAHLNGTVDVAFDPRNSDPALYGGDSAAFNPESETCSAVACHPGGKDYRWAAPHKGLPALPEETP